LKVQKKLALTTSTLTVQNVVHMVVRFIVETPLTSTCCTVICGLRQIYNNSK